MISNKSISDHSRVTAGQYVYQEGTVSVGDFLLENGEIVKNLVLAYERAGAVSAPVVLVCHALTGSQYTVGTDGSTGWWNGLIAQGSYVDLNQFQVITFNVLGGCSGSTGPMSVNPETGQRYRSNFPVLTVRDMVNAQYAALRTLGVGRLRAVIGGSLGGMQAFEWGIIYPAFMDSLIIIAATPYLSDYAIAFNTIGKQAIIKDPDWNNGDYEPDTILKGLEIARMTGMVTYRSAKLFNKRFNRRQVNEVYDIESYLTYQGEKLSARFDANSYLTLLQAMNLHDIGFNRNGWREAVKRVKARVTAIGFEGDLLYPPAEIDQVIQELKQRRHSAEFYKIETDYGHDGFLAEFDKWGPIIKEELNSNGIKDVKACLPLK
ncbi:homoserine O-acetyltransferase MetX [Mesobacillus harenae]|uniref:homoserine O-acetyltransferase MetX n=1 Tax=Mesobacillus harenae TaxID=2213203 RepID=UPI0030D38EEB